MDKKFSFLFAYSGPGLVLNAVLKEEFQKLFHLFIYSFIRFKKCLLLFYVLKIFSQSTCHGRAYIMNFKGGRPSRVDKCSITAALYYRI